MHAGISDYRSFTDLLIAILECKPGHECHCRLLASPPGREDNFTATAFLPLRDLPLQAIRLRKAPVKNSLLDFLAPLFWISSLQGLRLNAEATVIA